MPGLKKEFIICKGFEVCYFENLHQFFPPHFHDYYLLGCLKQGLRILNLNHKEYLITPANLVLLNLHQTHECKPFNNTSCAWICLNVSSNIMHQLFGYKYLPYFTKNICNDKKAVFKFITFCNGLREHSFLNSHTLKQILDCFPVIENSSLKNNYFPEIPIFSEKFPSVAELAMQKGVSQFKYIRNFASVYGITPHRYMEIMRMNRGRELLQKGVKISEAAITTGFYDQSHFSRFFNRITGLTPGMVRNSYKFMWGKK